LSFREKQLVDNVGIRMRPIIEKQFVTVPTDSAPSVFWITNPNNSFVGNHAVGGKFGFWYSMPVNPVSFTQFIHKLF